ncbi:MAG: hypothetical protein LE180_04150 [Endomicrobium sp.]|uniref:thiamine pyrophosphate-dependent enzyme n=1 Tax=Candidatus Endomicrobiellum pyrsonymphae TaxID=1408203 RepID=UPI003574B2D1|nr:hypothetical protein [Endomicrobium sp.]
MISRELYELRDEYEVDHSCDFLAVGSMGHASPRIALSLALQKPDKRVTVIDGDGVLLMRMGTVPTIGVKKPINFTHIVMNNATHG